MSRKETEAIIISIDINKGNRDLVFQNELFVALSQNHELLGFYCQLEWCAMTGIIDSCPTQKQLATLLGMTSPTFIKRRNALQAIGLLEVVERGTQREYRFKAFDRLPPLKPPKTFKEIPHVLETARKALKLTTEGTPNGQLTLIEKTITEQEKIPHQTFPKVNYDRVIAAYQQYKGIHLQGPEIKRALREVKQMFLAGHSVNDIIDCMLWFSENVDNEETPWVKFWILSTVMKKIAEFKAGKLKVRRLGDDLPIVKIPKK